MKLCTVNLIWIIINNGNINNGLCLAAINKHIQKLHADKNMYAQETGCF